MVTRSKKKEEILLEVKKLSKDSVLPAYAMESDIGLDIVASETVQIYPMEQKIVKTGIAIQIPEGHVGLIRDRAGIVSKMNVHTAAGTFDPGYRGEISVVLVNLGEQTVEIEQGMKIAQIVLLPVTRAKIKEVKKLSETKRGDKGFGSTDVEKKLEEIEKLSRSLSK